MISSNCNSGVQSAANNTQQSFDLSGINRFGERLKIAIGDESLLSFAKKCGLSDSLIGRYIRGASYPGIDKLALIASATGRSIEWLITGKSEGVADNNAQEAEQREELMEWWEIIFRSMSNSELKEAVNSFKEGGKSALFQSHQQSDVTPVSTNSLTVAKFFESLEPTARKEILALYGYSEQGGLIAPIPKDEAPGKKAG